MIKRISAVVLIVIFALNMTACNGENNTQNPSVKGEKEVFKVGVILTGDKNEGDSKSHIQGIKQAAQELSLTEDQIVWEYTIKADDKSYDTAKKLVDSGCDVIISNNKKYQEYMQQAAKDNPDADFVVIGGDTADESGLSNFHNAYTSIYQARYLTGIVAGLKIKELAEQGKLPQEAFDVDSNVKIGYVGTLPGSDVTSSYSAFYLGVKSVYENVSMYVLYTNKRDSTQAEIDATSHLVSQGCMMIVQNSELDGVYQAVEQTNSEGKLCFCVGFGDETTAKDKEWMLVCAKNNWDVYYKEAIGQSMKNEDFDSDWVAGLDEGAVCISAPNQSCCEDTKQKIDEAEEGLISQQIKVFSTDSFKVNGKEVNSAYATDTDGDDVPDEDQAVFDSEFHESYFRSAPYFSLDIDGITVLN